ncbi:putative surface cell antigen sca1 isoform X2 [Mercenaria mercenaria]|uniref:putative surface cell antigen sca1 isoform X2 n=1 Tax=Mercenaria mercenaria TaxID=6596 RepID=UPI00234E6B8E|nr:putative surface cell antigen sca1 isoform X2 [Mercenaria mercenaria]
MEDRDRNGWGSFLKMFRRKKKTKAHLLHSLKQLSLTTEEQISVIQALTEQNKQYQDVRQMQETILNMTPELQKLKDQNAVLQEKLETTMRQLMKTEQNLELREEKEDWLVEINDKLSRDLRKLERNVGELQTHAAVYQERLRHIDEQNKTLRASSEKFKDELEATKSKYDEVNLKSKLLEQEFAYNTEKLHKMTDQVNNLQKDKLLIMSYYTKQLSENSPASKPWVACPANQGPKHALTVDTTDGRLILNNGQVADEIHPDALENITQKNKLMNLENKLFRKEQLIDELLTVIKEHDPEFNIQDHPSLKIYLDTELPHSEHRSEQPLTAVTSTQIN